MLEYYKYMKAVISALKNKPTPPESTVPWKCAEYLERHRISTYVLTVVQLQVQHSKFVQNPDK